MWKTIIGVFIGTLAALSAFFGVLAMLFWRWLNTPLGEKMKLITPTPVPPATSTPFATPTIDLARAQTAIPTLLDSGYTWLWVIVSAAFVLLVVWLILEVRGIRVKK